jgi:molybdate transport system substrate-binding protein
VLSRADITVSPKSLEADVKAAVARVTSGDADAAIVYATDVHAAGAQATGVEIPDSQNIVADYPIAVVKTTAHRAAADAFISSVTSGSGREALERNGFLRAS